MLGEPAKQRLAQVEVRVHEPGQHERAAGVEGLRDAAAGQRGQRGRRAIAQRGDAAIHHQQVAARHGARRIHAHQRAAVHQERAQAFASVRQPTAGS